MTLNAHAQYVEYLRAIENHRVAHIQPLSVLYCIYKVCVCVCMVARCYSNFHRPLPQPNSLPVVGLAKQIGRVCANGTRMPVCV